MAYIEVDCARLAPKIRKFPATVPPVVESPRCHCARFEDLRSGCVRRLEEAIRGLDLPELKTAISNRDLALFCGDQLRRGLPPEAAHRVDTVVCDYMKLLGRKRSELWKAHCREGSEWALR